MDKKSHFPTGPSLTSEPLSTEPRGFSSSSESSDENRGYRCRGRDAVGEQSRGWEGGLSSRLASAHTPSRPTGASL